MKKLFLFLLIIILINTAVYAEETSTEERTVTISGINIVGRTMEAVCSSELSQQECTFRWLRKVEYIDLFLPISGAKGKTYVTTSDDENKYIKCEVTTTSGETYTSEAYRIKPETYPEAYDVTVNGSGKHGEVLYADYHYRDGNEEPQMNVYYRWLVSENSSMGFSDISGETSQSFVPGEEYIGKYIRVSVKADKLGDGSYPSAGYTSSSSILIRSKPAASDVEIIQGDKLTGKYTYSDAAGVKEDGTLTSWEVSSEQYGSYSAISHEEQLTLPELGEPYYIRYSVTPQNAEGTTGDKVSSEPLYIGALAAVTHYPASADFDSDGQLNLELNSPAVCASMVAELNTEATDLVVESDALNVDYTFKNGTYVCVFTSKTSESFCTDSADIILKSSSQASIEVKSVTLLSENEVKSVQAGISGIDVPIITGTVQDFEGLTVGETAISDVPYLGVENSGAKTTFEIVENLYGATGKALKVTQTGNVNSVSGFAAGVTMSKTVDMSEKWGMHVNFYVPDVSKDITIGLYATLGGKQIYYNASSTDVKSGWNLLKMYSDGAYVRFYVNNTGAIAKVAVSSLALSGTQTALFRLRQVNTNASYTGWYLIDNLTAPATTTGFMDGTGLAYDSTTEYAFTDTASVITADATLKAVKVAADGSTTVLADSDKLYNATHIFETAEVGTYELYPINLSGNVISGVEPYMTVAKFKADFKEQIGDVSVKTEAGVEAYDNMLMNENMTVTLANGTECTIKADKNTAFEPVSDASKADGHAGIDYTNEGTSINGLWGIANITRARGKGTGVFKSVQNGVNGYKFSYNGTNDGVLNIRAHTAAMDTTKMSAGDVTVYEMNIKPSAIGYYNVNFRWYNGALKTDEAIFGSKEQTPGITFNTDGKIYLGGFRGTETSTTGMKELCAYSPDTSYEVKLVVKTPSSNDRSMHIYGVYINDVLYAKNTVLNYRDSYDTTNGAGITSMAEVDYMFKPSAAGTAYDLYLWGVKCYTADNFSTEKTDITDLKYENNTFTRTLHFYDTLEPELMMIAATYEGENNTVLKQADIAQCAQGVYTAAIDATAFNAKVFMLEKNSLSPLFKESKVIGGIITDTAESNCVR